MLPAFFHAPGAIKHVLALGVGGAAIQLIRQIDNQCALQPG
jgi:hypothetical protein